MRQQKGQVLLMALLFLSVGSLLVIPVLSYTADALRSQSIFQTDVIDQNAGDAAISDVIWKILEEGALTQIDPDTGQYVYDFNLDLARWGVTVNIPNVTSSSEWQALRVNMFCKMEVFPDFQGALGERTFRYLMRLDMPSWDLREFHFSLPNGLIYDNGSAVHLIPVAQNEVDPDAAVEPENFSFKYNGSNWSSSSNGTTEYLRGIWGSSSSDIFAVGGGGTILHYNGSVWSEMTSVTTADLTGVWGSSSSNVFAVGVSGMILHYDGSAWTFMDSGSNQTLRDIWGNSGSNIFAVGDNDTLLHYNGSIWSPMYGTGVADTLDQSQITWDGTRQIYGSNWRSQLFEAAVGGKLTSIDLKASASGSPPNGLTVELRNATEIYETVLDQSQTSYDSTKQIYANNWSSQLFRAGISGTLKDVTLRAAKVGGPPNGLTVELRNVTEGFEELISPSQTTQNSTYTLYPAVNWISQTFQAAYSGPVTKGVLWGSRTNLVPTVPLTVELRNTVSGLPGTTVLASTTIPASDFSETPAEHVFTFATPASVTAGTTYSIVVYATTSVNNKAYNIGYTTANPYAGGSKCTSANSGSTWTSATQDMYFKIYTNQSIGNVPGSTVYATTTKSDIAAAGDYDFIFSSTYSITAGTDYALVMHTTGGDGTNYYTTAYKNSEGYANGKKCDSANAGVTWAGTTQDMYFKTHVQRLTGYDTGATIFATATRSDITALGDYKFNFDIPYTVTPTIKYAIVIHTTGGSSGSCYNVAYKSSDCYASGKEYSSSNAGTNWTSTDAVDMYFKTYVLLPKNIYSVWGKNSDVFTVGSSGNIMRYNGSSWSDMTSGTTQNLFGIWGNSASDVFAVGSAGSILHYNGSAWSAMTNPDPASPQNTLRDVWGTSASDVFAAGEMGTVLHYNGSAWSQMTSNTTNNLKSIWGSSSTNVFAIGNSSTRYWYTKGTSEWRYMTTGDWIEGTIPPTLVPGVWYLQKTWEADGRQTLTWAPGFEGIAGSRTYIMVFEATGIMDWGIHYITPIFSDGTTATVLQPTAGVVAAMYNILITSGGQTIQAVIGINADGTVQLISYQVIG